MRELDGGIKLLEETPRQVLDASLLWLCSHIADIQFPEKTPEEREAIAYELLKTTIESTWEMLLGQSRSRQSKAQ